MIGKLRTHQHLIHEIALAISAGGTEIRDILAAVTPGGGKSLLPVIAASHLIRAGIAEKVCWVVPRDTLRLQAEEAFVDPAWRTELGHGVTVRAAENTPDLCRGLQGYVTTYQAIAAAPDLHLAEFRRHRYLLCIDEMHHLPALSDLDALTQASEETAWSRAILPLVESAAVRLLLSGTLQRADGRAILWLPYRRPRGARKVRLIDFEAPGWAIVGYSRRQALAERAILPVTFGALDGEAEWRDPLGRTRSVRALSTATDTVKDALFTALRTEFADALLRQAFKACRAHRALRREALGAVPGADVRGLGKLLVVAPDQAAARKYLATLRGWARGGDPERMVRLAVSDVRDGHEAIAEFRLHALPAVLVTVAMAYEGMDAPEVTHVACLTHIRSRPWLEQMIARATRVDPHGPRYEDQVATVFHPDDPMFRRFRHEIETEQGTKAQIRKCRQPAPPFDGGGDDDRHRPGITPLHSNATALRFDMVAPGPDFGLRQAEAAAGAQRALFEPPSVAEARLRQRIGQMVAAQVIEDEDSHVIDRRTSVGYHAYNAVLKAALYGKSRAEMTVAELEAAIGWLERNRLSDHLHLIEDDQRYKWSRARNRKNSKIRVGPHWV